MRRTLGALAYRTATGGSACREAAQSSREVGSQARHLHVGRVRRRRVVAPSLRVPPLVLSHLPNRARCLPAASYPRCLAGRATRELSSAAVCVVLQRVEGEGGETLTTINELRGCRCPLSSALSLLQAAVAFPLLPLWLSPIFLCARRHQLGII